MGRVLVRRLSTLGLERVGPAFWLVGAVESGCGKRLA
jgi:hypothetical protein